MRRGATAAALLAVAALAGCGGDDKSSGGTSEREWGERVNEVCVDNQKAVREVLADVQDEKLSQQDSAAEVLERSMPVQRRLLTRLRAIEAPADIQPDYDRFLDRIEAALPLFQQLADDTRAGKEDPELITRFSKVAAETRPFATEHDLTECLPDQAG